MSAVPKERPREDTGRRRKPAGQAESSGQKVNSQAPSSWCLQNCEKMSAVQATVWCFVILWARNNRNPRETLWSLRAKEAGALVSGCSLWRLPASQMFGTIGHRSSADVPGDGTRQPSEPPSPCSSFLRGRAAGASGLGLQPMHPSLHKQEAVQDH